MRGYQETDFFQAQPIKPILQKNSWASVSEALRDGLSMEKAVTGSMKNMENGCSTKNCRPSDRRFYPLILCS